MTLRLDSILCAVDFSVFSDRVLDLGIRLAGCFQARLFVFHAVCFPSDQLYSSDVLERGEKRQLLTARAHQKITERMAACDLTWQAVVQPGDPVEQIRRCVRKEAVDLVVAASHGLSGVKRILLGTVVERLARSLPVPLLVTRPATAASHGSPGPSSLPLKRIVVGCRQAAATDPVLDFATGFAAPLDAELHLVHAIEAPMDETLVDPTQGPYGEVQNTLQQRLAHRLEQTVDDTVRSRFRIKTSACAGLPGEALGAYAADNQMDLIMVGVARHSLMEHLLVGSTTEAVMRTAPCPVMTVPYRSEL